MFDNLFDEFHRNLYAGGELVKLRWISTIRSFFRTNRKSYES